MKHDLFIFPFNGNGVEALDCLGEQFNLLGFIDDTPEKQGMNQFGQMVYTRLHLQHHSNAKVLAVPGSPASYKVRDKIISDLGISTENYATVIHPKASVSPLAKIGNNVMIMAGVVITSNAVIEDHVCILPNTVIHHDVVVGKYSLIGSNVSIAGSTIIGQNCYIGSGSRLINNITVGKYALIGLGSNVIKSIGENSKVVGNPAKSIE
ncbi:MAG: acetyltransferase [Bacteroidota bacterium]|nr:acetyltransferase [Bacteroidota bacterium]